MQGLEYFVHNDYRNAPKNKFIEDTFISIHNFVIKHNTLWNKSFNSEKIQPIFIPSKIIPVG